MPKATVSHEHIRYELKTCPGGFVTLRTLSFHEMMQRRDVASRLWAEFGEGKGRKKKQQDEAARAQLEVMNVAVMEFEFKNCIVDHNLEDENGKPLDFNNPMSLRVLDPKIGQEINRYIEELTQEEDEDDVDPLLSAPISSLPDGATKPELAIPEKS